MKEINHILTLWDLALAPVFIFILSKIAMRTRDKYYPKGHPLRPYYMKGLYLKFSGAIFIALVYQFYYGSGDTLDYFNLAKLINSSLDHSYITWLKLITRQPYETNPELYEYVSEMTWYRDPASYSVGVVTAIFGLFTGMNYIPIALLFAYFSFTGIWAMYRTFANIYPELYKKLAIVFLFIPSTFVWGSSIFKDTICMFALGWLCYTTFRVFVNRDFSFKNLALLALGFYLLLRIKVYILLAFVPALAIWLLMTYSGHIRSTGLRMTIKIVFIGVVIAGFLAGTSYFASSLNSYSLDNIAKTATVTKDWIKYASGDEGSAYDLGQFDPTIGGMVGKFPQAVVATLFRPFPWEVKKVIVALSALEAMIFAYFTFKAFRRRGIAKTFATISKDPNLFFFLIFSVIFAFAVGITSYNFGALSRYKIPCLPFYGALLVVLIYRDRGEDKRAAYRPEEKKAAELMQAYAR